GLHNLKAMVFNNKNQLFINVGSATNVCAKFGLFAKKMKSCPEVEDLAQGQGQIRMYQMLPNGKFDPKFTVYAKGLRNSMGLLFDSQLNALIQVENGRDEINKVSSAFSDNEFPHEEMNIIENGKHYGWPYCFDDNKNNPEWRHVNCSNYRAPYLLLPPHAAPLSIIKHSGTNLPQWYRNRIIASFHGYAQYGHRIVSFLRDENGLPTGVPLSIVYNWKTEENKPGSPVGIFEMKDGSMLIVEDNNKKLLRLHYNEAEGDGKPVREIDLAHAEENIDSEEETRRLKLEEVLRDKDASAFARFQSQVIDRQCVQCHGSEASPGIQLKKYDYLGNEKKLKELGKEQEILGRISGNPNYPTMPPSGFSSKEEQDQAVALLRAWIKEK
ncbi:MAG: PQQ-dependent sugar dehydrogenase, partial [Bacteriovorax sp.]